jgi:hypothetical protein
MIYCGVRVESGDEFVRTSHAYEGQCSTLRLLVSTKFETVTG